MTIQKTTSLYNKVMLWTLSGLSLVLLLMIQLTGMIHLVNHLVIAVVFSLVCGTAYIQGWRLVARRSPELLPKYYLAGSAFRLMAAAVVVLVYCVFNRHDVTAIKWFSIVFIVYYVVMLIFDAVFFAKVSKNNNK